jgi:Flp pilus assembly protein TadD
MPVRRLLGAVGAIAVLLWCTGAMKVTFARRSEPAKEVTRRASASDNANGNQCKGCHLEEVEGFEQSKMAHSMRVGAKEPVGVVQVPGTTITMTTDAAHGSWQSVTSKGTTDQYRVDYVIGSGTHASGYIMDLGGHLFQSPVAYYRSRSAYGLAPGYEGKPDPDFTRPIGEGCVFCHAGSFDAVAGTQNGYGKVPFPHLTIGCERCHGDAAAHLAKPEMGNIVNPPHLEAAARDSVCEQCHLIGVARVLNPGKRFSDFKPGDHLEKTFTIYHNEAPKGTEAAFRVISHSEQLALSRCARNSEGRLWCGTCHDPHQEPVEAVSYYRERCMQCHAKTSFASDHPAKTSNCIGCHMPRRETNDGGHTAFTDHRIQRRPEHGVMVEATEIAAWREPSMELAKRNLGIATVDAGMERRSGKQIVEGYRMLTEVQKQFLEDSEMYLTMGSALLAGRQFGEAVQAFELAVRYDPESSPKETSLGQAYAAMGEQGLAEQHLEKAMRLDPVNLSAAGLLIGLYDRNGEESKADELSKRLASLVGRSGAAH